MESIRMGYITLRKWAGPVVVAFGLISLGFSALTASASQNHQLGVIASGIFMVGIGGYLCSWNDSFGRAFVRSTLLLSACITSLGIAFIIAFVRESSPEMFLQLAGSLLLLCALTAKMAGYE